MLGVEAGRGIGCGGRKEGGLAVGAGRGLSIKGYIFSRRWKYYFVEYIFSNFIEGCS